MLCMAPAAPARAGYIGRVVNEQAKQMSKLTDSLKSTARKAEAKLDALDRLVTESEATLATATLVSRKMDVRAAEAQRLIAEALAL